MKILSHLLCLLLALFNTQISASDYKTKLETYPVPHHGELVLRVPADWSINHVSWGEEKPPVITFYDKDKEKRELFQLNISTLWDDGFSRNVTTPNSIKDLVEKVGNDVLKYSDEDELILESIAGSSGQGFYFSVSDSTVRSGEYQYLTQGAVAVGEIVLVFSLFTHDGEASLQEKTLEMIRTAIQKHQRDVQFPGLRGLTPSKIKEA